jgi:hypothetical protein
MSFEAAAADRLPWLADEPAPQRVAPRGGSLLPWAVAALAVVAFSGFWIGTRSEHEGLLPAQRHSASTTVLLPPPRPVAPEQVQIAPQPEIRPAPLPEVHPARVREIYLAPVPVHRTEAKSAGKPEAVAVQGSPAPAQTPPQQIAAPTTVTPPAPKFVIPKPWNPHFSSGAAGRLVQIGAFGSVHQAKRGWWFMVHDYPAMAHLPALVRETRNSKGRTFYRFDVGTTSQAHSEVLCQRMRKISLSCAVIGLPWKAKVER